MRPVYWQGVFLFPTHSATASQDLMSIPFIRPLQASLALALLMPASTWAADESKTEAPEKPAKSETDAHTVKTERFDFAIRLNGTLMPAEAKPIIAAPERFSSLRITSIAPNASYVKKGDTLLTFDLTELEKLIESYEKSIVERELGLLRAKNELTSLKKLTPMQMAENKRALERAKDDHKYLLETRIPLGKESIEREVLSAERSLAYSSEELRQLEKMYTDDDLTEETEEIVLKRSRWAVEGAEFRLKNAKIDADRQLEVNIPRQINDAKEEIEKRAISLARAEIELPAALEQNELEVAALEKELNDYRDALTELKADQKHLTNMTAPIDGIVLYGDWTGSQPPSNVADIERRLLIGSSFGVHTTFITVVSQTPGAIAVSLPEQYRSLVNWNGKTTESPTETGRYAALKASNAVAFGVGIEWISPTLQADNTYATKLTIDTKSDAFSDQKSFTASPGMNASVTLVDYESPEAVMIPSDYIQIKFKNGKLLRYVHLLGDDETTTEAPVTYQRASKENVEILTGLKAGDKISKEAK